LLNFFVSFSLSPYCSLQSDGKVRVIQAQAKSEKNFVLLTAAGEGNKQKFFEIVAIGDVDVRNVHFSHFR